MIAKTSLKDKTRSSIGWSAIERLSHQGLSFAIQILLARLVDPKEYGLLALMVIFVTFAQLVIDGGFTQAIIQKEELKRRDISTAFFFNLFTSLVLYLILFLFAPIIADYYAEPRLVVLIRVLSLNLVVRSLGLVQLSVFTRKLQFKQLFKTSVPAVILSGIAGVTAAFWGMEVWALVIFQMANVAIMTLLLWMFTDRNDQPQIEFSWLSLKSMASFGMAMLGSSLVTFGVQNVYGILIGKYFNLTQLGYYNRARSFHKTPSSALNAVLNRVLFPVFSKIQKSNEQIVAALRSGIPVIVFTVGPFMIFLMLASEEVVTLLLTKKWLPSADLMKWFPIIGISFPLVAVQQSVIKAKGRSDIFLAANLVRSAIALTVLWFTIQQDVMAVVIGQVCVSLFNNLFINMPICSYVCGYRLGQQAIDIAPYLIAAIIPAALIGWVSCLLSN